MPQKVSARQHSEAVVSQEARTMARQASGQAAGTARGLVVHGLLKGLISFFSRIVGVVRVEGTFPVNCVRLQEAQVFLRVHAARRREILAASYLRNLTTEIHEAGMHFTHQKSERKTRQLHLKIINKSNTRGYTYTSPPPTATPPALGVLHVGFRGVSCGF